MVKISRKVGVHADESWLPCGRRLINDISSYPIKITRHRGNLVVCILYIAWQRRLRLPLHIYILVSCGQIKIVKWYRVATLYRNGSLVTMQGYSILSWVFRGVTEIFLRVQKLFPVIAWSEGYHRLGVSKIMPQFRVEWWFFLKFVFSAKYDKLGWFRKSFIVLSSNW